MSVIVHGGVPVVGVAVARLVAQLRLLTFSLRRLLLYRLRSSAGVRFDASGDYRCSVQNGGSTRGAHGILSLGSVRHTLICRSKCLTKAAGARS